MSSQHSIECRETGVHQHFATPDNQRSPESYISPRLPDNLSLLSHGREYLAGDSCWQRPYYDCQQWQHQPGLLDYWYQLQAPDLQISHSSSDPQCSQASMQAGLLEEQLETLREQASMEGQSGFYHHQQSTGSALLFATAPRSSQLSQSALPEPQTDRAYSEHEWQSDLTSSPLLEPNPSSEGEEMLWSREESPNTCEMDRLGNRNKDGTYTCSYLNCTSRTSFRRACDLRKHYKRHTKTLRCRYSGCDKALKATFSSEKDRARHEAKHDPKIPCSERCGRLFSRMDNMKDHVKRKHSDILLPLAQDQCATLKESKQISGVLCRRRKF